MQEFEYSEWGRCDGILARVTKVQMDGQRFFLGPTICKNLHIDGPVFGGSDDRKANRPQPYVSQQLRVLRKAGIIERRRGGCRGDGDERYVYYRLADPWARQLVEAALGPLDPVSAFETGPPGKGNRANAGGQNGLINETANTTPRV